ncbi:MAG: hypothetical protein ACM3OF_00180 [Gemmatimonas sp.]
MKTFLTIVAVLTAVSSPAFAQSFCTCDGTGNVLPFSHKGSAPQNDRTAFRDSALRAFAGPEGYGASGPNAPEATGGGSPGYNEMLRNF